MNNRTFWNEKEMKLAIRKWKYTRKANKDQVFADLIHKPLLALCGFKQCYYRKRFLIKENAPDLAHTLCSLVQPALYKYTPNHGTTSYTWAAYLVGHELHKMVQIGSYKKRDVSKTDSLNAITSDLERPFQELYDRSTGLILDEEKVELLLEWWDKIGIEKHFHGKSKVLVRLIVDVLLGNDCHVFTSYSQLQHYLLTTAGVTRQRKKQVLDKMRTITQLVEQEIFFDER